MKLIYIGQMAYFRSHAAIGSIYLENAFERVEDGVIKFNPLPKYRLDWASVGYRLQGGENFDLHGTNDQQEAAIKRYLVENFYDK
jgi:hypothetical protein